MNFVLDTHTHTIASGHAYSTMNEMILAAKEKGLDLLCLTEHSINMPGTCHEYYFHNLRVVPREQHGVRLLMGSELNIIDYEGNVDMPQFVIDQLDICLASLHSPCIKPGTMEQNTAAMIGAMHKPYVSIIGHPDNGLYPVDYEAVVKEAIATNTLLELNNSSLNPNGFRLNAHENARIYLNLCKKYGAHISLGSDAHICYDILNFKNCVKLLEELDFPEELIVNRNADTFLEFINRKKQTK